ncbi:MAG: hypothetical protein ABSF80_07540 [Chitinispirillaceae bacterium]|jgi:hypothetical protein
MDVFTQRLPYEGFAKRTITLEQDKLVIDYKNIARSLTDDYSYGKIDPVFKTIRRGETEWSSIVYGLVITSMVFFILSKMSPSLLFKSIVLGIQVCTVVIAVYLLALIFYKKAHIYVLDTSGDCILALKSTPKSRAFAAKLKAKVESAAKQKAA